MPESNMPESNMPESNIPESPPRGALTLALALDTELEWLALALAAVFDWLTLALELPAGPELVALGLELVTTGTNVAMPPASPASPASPIDASYEVTGQLDTDESTRLWVALAVTAASKGSVGLALAAASELVTEVVTEFAVTTALDVCAAVVLAFGLALALGFALALPELRVVGSVLASLPASKMPESGKVGYASSLQPELNATASVNTPIFMVGRLMSLLRSTE